MHLEVREVEDSDFEALASLYMLAHSKADQPLGSIPSMYKLTHDIAHKKDFIALGLYSENLVGFATGHALSDDMFYFSCIYIKQGYRNKSTKKLYDLCVAKIASLGYIRWEADCSSPLAAKMLERYGAKPTYTRYRGEL